MVNVLLVLLCSCIILLLTTIGYFCYTLDKRVTALENNAVRPVSYQIPVKELKLLDPVVPTSIDPAVVMPRRR